MEYIDIIRDIFESRDKKPFKVFLKGFPTTQDYYISEVYCWGIQIAALSDNETELRNAVFLNEFGSIGNDKKSIIKFTKETIELITEKDYKLSNNKYYSDISFTYPNDQAKDYVESLRNLLNIRFTTFKYNIDYVMPMGYKAKYNSVQLPFIITDAYIRDMFVEDNMDLINRHKNILYELNKIG